MAHGYPDFEGEKSKVYLTPEWAAKEGTDKTLDASADDQGFGGFALLSYTVPTGKTFYISAMSFFSQIRDAADYDHPAHVIAGLTIAGEKGGSIGGDGGGLLLFPKPLVANAAELVAGLVVNNSNVDCTVSIHIWGYEV